MEVHDFFLNWQIINEKLFGAFLYWEKIFEPKVDRLNMVPDIIQGETRVSVTSSNLSKT